METLCAQHRGRHAGEQPELARQVGLIKVSQADRSLGEAFAVRQIGDRALQACDSRKVLGCDTDLVQKSPTQVLTTACEFARQCLDRWRRRARQSSHGLTDLAIGSRRRRQAPEQPALQLGERARARTSITAKAHSEIGVAKLLDRNRSIGEVHSRDTKQRHRTTWLEPHRHQLRIAQSRDQQGARHRSHHLGEAAVDVEDHVDAAIGQDAMRRVRTPRAVIAAHPEAVDEPPQRGFGLDLSIRHGDLTGNVAGRRAAESIDDSGQLLQ